MDLVGVESIWIEGFAVAAVGIDSILVKIAQWLETIGIQFQISLGEIRVRED